jgi:predicted nuclease of predicted toxin-antitoxin system
MPLCSAPKLYLDEHVSPRLAAQLRRYGFDAISCQEAQTLSLSDADQLAFASDQQRAIVTFNVSDFVILHTEYASTQKTHWGVVLSTEELIGVLLHRLLRLLNTVSANELKDQLRWLNEFR